MHILDGKEKVELTDKIEIIKKEIVKLKYVINEFMKNQYDELESSSRPDETLVNKSEMLVNDMKVLQDRIEKQVIFMKIKCYR